jgi:predicted nucleic acid-binding protein
MQDDQIRLDHGESEAIVLYFEKNMDLLLLDDGEARKIAASYGIPIMGTGGILLVAKRKGFVSSLRTELEKLDMDGAFRLSDAVKEMLLRSANE